MRVEGWHGPRPVYGGEGGAKKRKSVLRTKRKVGGEGGVDAAKPPSKEEEGPRFRRNLLRKENHGKKKPKGWAKRQRENFKKCQKKLISKVPKRSAVWRAEKTGSSPKVRKGSK